MPRANTGTIPHGGALPAIAKHEDESRKRSLWKEAYNAQVRSRTILGLDDDVRTLLEGRRTSGAAAVVEAAAKVQQDVGTV